MAFLIHKTVFLTYRAADGTARLWFVGDESDAKNVRSISLDHQLSNSNCKSVSKDVTAIDWSVSLLMMPF